MHLHTDDGRRAQRQPNGMFVVCMRDGGSWLKDNEQFVASEEELIDLLSADARLSTRMEAGDTGPLTGNAFSARKLLVDGRPLHP